MLETALKFIHEINSHGYKAYIVGGFVRDHILGIESHDIDINTNATPKEIKEIFENSCLPAEDYGSVTVIKHGVRFEVTTFRKDICYINNRRPAEVKYIDNLYDDESFFDGIESSLVFKNYEDIDIEAMTMHKSKGLTFDDVIIIGLNTSFPSVKTGMTWIEKLYRNEVIDEGIPFAEERRLFYVALTRTKNHVYLLCDKNLKKDSEFISEIYGIMKSNMVGN